MVSYVDEAEEKFDFEDVNLHNLDTTRYISRAQLAQHKSIDDCWVAIHGKVYDFTDFASEHGGGVEPILPYFGTDATAQFDKSHRKPKLSELPAHCCIGELEKPMEIKRVYSGTIIARSEVAKHNTVDDCWVVVHGKVYDMTSYIQVHGGGIEAVAPYFGADASHGFDQNHPPSKVKELPKHCCIGQLESSTTKQLNSKNAQRGLENVILVSPYRVPKYEEHWKAQAKSKGFVIPRPACWMKDLSQRIGGKRLTEIAIPGTHNSFAYGFTADSFSDQTDESICNTIAQFPEISEPRCAAANWSNFQSKNVNEQLSAGIRYFDSTIGKFKDNFRVCHSLVGPRIETFLEKINKFLDKRRKEIVILNFRRFVNMEFVDHAAFVRILTSSFGRKICVKQSCLGMTISELQKAHSQVLIFYNNEIAKDVDELWSHSFLESYQPLVCSKTSELEVHLENITEKQNEANQSAKLWVLSSTVDPSKQIIENSLKDGNPTSVQSLATLTCPIVIDLWMSKCPSLKINIVQTDWFHETELVEACLSFNNSQKVFNSFRKCYEARRNAQKCSTAMKKLVSNSRPKQISQILCDTSPPQFELSISEYDRLGFGNLLAQCRNELGHQQYREFEQKLQHEATLEQLAHLCCSLLQNFTTPAESHMLYLRLSKLNKKRLIKLSDLCTNSSKRRLLDICKLEMCKSDYDKILVKWWS